MLERELIYRKDHKENMKLFRDVKSQKLYSIYATELNRVFGERTYDQFYKGLLENKKIRINNFKKMFEKPVVKKGIKNIEEPFDIKIFTNCLKKMDKKSKEFIYKLKNRYFINSSFYKKLKEEKEKRKEKDKENDKFKIFLPEIPDIGRYNPNYDAIRTHAFYPILAPSDYDNFNKYKKNVYAHQMFIEKESKKDSFINLSYKNKRSKIFSNHFNTEGNIRNIPSSKSKHQSKNSLRKTKSSIL